MRGRKEYRGNWPGAEIEMTEEERASAMGAMGGERVQNKIPIFK